MADWVPPSGSKRARSPVEKLADLQMQEDEDEDNWRTSKRYFTEVCAYSTLDVKSASIAAALISATLLGR